MSETTVVCPYCGGTIPADATICPDCQEDLSALVQLRYTPAIRYNTALAAARDGDLNNARAELLLALECDADFAPAHVLLAKVLALQGDWVQAEAHIERALTLLPDDERANRVAEEIAAGARKAERTRAARPVQERVAAATADPLRTFGLGVALTVVATLVVRWLFGRD